MTPVRWMARLDRAGARQALLRVVRGGDAAVHGQPGVPPQPRPVPHGVAAVGDVGAVVAEAIGRVLGSTLRRW
jgi:hypothetical protein